MSSNGMRPVNDDRRVRGSPVRTSRLHVLVIGLAAAILASLIGAAPAFGDPQAPFATINSTVTAGNLQEFSGQPVTSSYNGVALRITSDGPLDSVCVMDEKAGEGAPIASGCVDRDPFGHVSSAHASIALTAAPTSQATLAKADALLRRAHIHPRPLMPTRLPRFFAGARISVATGRFYSVFFSKRPRSAEYDTLEAFVGRIRGSFFRDLTRLSRLQGYRVAREHVRSSRVAWFIPTDESVSIVWKHGGYWYYTSSHTVLRYTLTRSQLRALANSMRPV